MTLDNPHNLPTPNDKYCEKFKYKMPIKLMTLYCKKIETKFV